MLKIFGVNFIKTRNFGMARLCLKATISPVGFIRLVSYNELMINFFYAENLTYLASMIILQPGKLLQSAHAVDREFKVMSAMEKGGVPVPNMITMCEDERLEVIIVHISNNTI